MSFCSEKKLTDEEIIESLRICANWKYGDCDKCPIGRSDCKGNIAEKMYLDFIYRQKAEIERLMEEKDRYQNKWHTAYMNELDLKRQVEELTNKLGKVLLVIKADEVLIAKGVEKAIEDTAREILIPLIETEKQIDPLKTGIRWSVLKGFCKKFGVEVE